MAPTIMLPVREVSLSRGVASGSMRTSKVRSSIAALAFLSSSIPCVGCSSMSKARLERELLALPKNAALGTLQRRTFEADLGDGPQTYELVYHHAPAKWSDEPGEDVPLVLVHGTPSTLFSWTEIVHGGPDFEGLAASRSVYAIEVIGHGIASGDARPYGFERCARFVNEAIRALGLDRVHIAGSSYGGEFAWRVALNDPELVESLMLLNSSGYARDDDDWLPEEVEMRENSLAKLGWLLNSRERIARALAPHFDVIPPDRTEEFFLVCENADNWKATIDLVRDENGDREAELCRIQAPTLVLWGASDVAYSLEDYGRRFARDIPRAELVVFPETGHYPHERRPAEVVQIMESFMDNVESSS